MRKYGWPLVLFIGVPFVACWGRTIAWYFYDSGALGAIEDFRFDVLSTAVLNFATTVLLGALYLRVRRLAQNTLPLVWSYTVVTAAIGVVPWVVGAVVDPDRITFLLWSLWVALFLSSFLCCSGTPAARPGSALHTPTSSYSSGGITLPYFLAEELPARELLKLAGGVLAVWLLANFDLRSPAFRRLAAIVVVALNGLLYLFAERFGCAPGDCALCRAGILAAPAAGLPRACPPPRPRSRCAVRSRARCADMRRFIVTYRWELLLLGIPAAGWIARIPTRLALEAFAARNDISSSTLSFPDTYASFGAIG